MLLEKNGMMSAGKRSRHLNVRFFFITDRVKSGELTVEHCPTDDLMVDFFTEPLQGTRFIKLRDMAMGETPFAPTVGHRSVLGGKSKVQWKDKLPSKATEIQKNTIDPAQNSNGWRRAEGRKASEKTGFDRTAQKI